MTVRVIVIDRGLVAPDDLQHYAAGLALFDALNQPQIGHTQAVALASLEVCPAQSEARTARSRELRTALDRTFSFVVPQALLPVEDGPLGSDPIPEIQLAWR